MQLKHVSLNKGFTIVELIVVIAVIAILVSITIVSYAAVTRNSREQSLTTDLRSLSTELQKFKSEKGSYPSSAVFASDIKKPNTSGSSTFSYTLNASTGRFCLSVSGYQQTWYLTSNNSTTKSGACPASF